MSVHRTFACVCYFVIVFCKFISLIPGKDTKKSEVVEPGNKQLLAMKRKQEEEEDVTEGVC